MKRRMWRRSGRRDSLALRKETIDGHGGAATTARSRPDALAACANPRPQAVARHSRLVWRFGVRTLPNRLEKKNFARSGWTGCWRIRSAVVSTAEPGTVLRRATQSAL